MAQSDLPCPFKTPIYTDFETPVPPNLADTVYRAVVNIKQYFFSFYRRFVFSNSAAKCAVRMEKVAEILNFH